MDPNASELVNCCALFVAHPATIICAVQTEELAKLCGRMQMPVQAQQWHAELFALAHSVRIRTRVLPSRASYWKGQEMSTPRLDLLAGGAPQRTVTLQSTLRLDCQCS